MIDLNRNGAKKTPFFFERKNSKWPTQKKNILLHSYLNQSQINGYQGWDEILMITLISNKKLGGYKIMRNTVDINLKSWFLIKSGYYIVPSPSTALISILICNFPLMK